MRDDAIDRLHQRIEYYIQTKAELEAQIERLTLENNLFKAALQKLEGERK